jgi:hypothetical protein
MESELALFYLALINEFQIMDFPSEFAAPNQHGRPVHGIVKENRQLRDRGRYHGYLSERVDPHCTCCSDWDRDPGHVLSMIADCKRSLLSLMHPGSGSRNPETPR